MNLQEPITFLETLFAEQDTILFRPVESWIEKGKKRNRVDYGGITHFPARRDVIPTFVHLSCERAADQLTNIFLGICPRVGGSRSERFDLSWQIRAVRCFWCDIDGALPEESLERCKTAKIPNPSIVVRSGPKGTHLYWLLEQPFLIDDVGDPPPVFTEWTETAGKRRPINYFQGDLGKVYLVDPKTGKPLSNNRPPLSGKATFSQDVVAGLAAPIGGDQGTHDIARLLRLAGSLHRKNQRNGTAPFQCHIFRIDRDCRYPVSSFERFAESSPEKQKREAVARVALPAPRKLTAKRTDRFNALLTACSVAQDRSSADFSLCCYSIRCGMQAGDVWSRVAEVGKFGERGFEYFSLTWSRAETRVKEQQYDKANATASRMASEDDSELDKEISNGYYEEGDGDEPELVAKSMRFLLSGVRKLSNDFPRVANGAMFVHAGDQVSWLQSQSEYFGWLHTVAPVDWYAGPKFITKGELFAEHRRQAPQYEAVENYPHEPSVPRCYYTCGDVSPGSGEYLTEFLKMFSPETDIDRDLMQACLMSMAWGGPGGSRPIFAFTGRGRGSGKTKTAEMLAEPFGGVISFATSEKTPDIKSRLLSPEGLDRRAAILDNVKARKFSWGDLEGLITSKYISGKRMYIGEASRPNMITWMITLNGLSFSKDMAQRSVILNIKRPRYNGVWEADVAKFVAEHRQELVADVIAALRASQKQLENYSRWGYWEREILERLPDPNEAQRVILERQAAADTDAEEAATIRETFRMQLESLHYDVTHDRVFIPSRVCADWYSLATGEKVRTMDATNTLKQLCEEGEFGNLRRNKANKFGRGFVWHGSQWDTQEPIRADIEERVLRRDRSLPR